MFEVYFKDFGKLKGILSSEKITPENIAEFLNSDLVNLISEATDCFDVTIKDIYRILLVNTEIKTKEEFNKHKSILADKSSSILNEPLDIDETIDKAKAKKNEKLSEISELFFILRAQSTQIIQKKPPQTFLGLGKGIFYIPKPVYFSNKRKMALDPTEEQPAVNNPITKRLSY